jgi:alkylhydroperoxidase family enzyme
LSAADAVSAVKRRRCRFREIGGFPGRPPAPFAAAIRRCRVGAMAFLGEPPETELSRRFYEDDLASEGYVGNLTRVWCWRPDVLESFGALRRLVTEGSALRPEDCAVLVAATASALGDSYCALAWGARLAGFVGEQSAADVLRGGADGLDERQHALAEWARRVVRDPNSTGERDVEALRSAGLDDRTIFEATAFVALRLAFSTVNDALGAAPDVGLERDVPVPVRDAVTFGRPAG